VLADAGVLNAVPLGLLRGSESAADDATLLQGMLAFVSDRDPKAHARRTDELAFLANAVLAGASLQGRPLAPGEASQAVLAVCNLGLERWPAQWLDTSAARGRAGGLPDDLLLRTDFIAAFQVGWTVLHEEVCLYAADGLIRALASVSSHDRDVRMQIERLKRRMNAELRRGTPWNARVSLEVLTLIDVVTWAAMVALTGELPVLHAAVPAVLRRDTGGIDPAAFQFIATPRDIARAREFVDLLPDRLRG
jgi:hypothetical protein